MGKLNANMLTEKANGIEYRRLVYSGMIIISNDFKFEPGTAR